MSFWDFLRDIFRKRRQEPAPSPAPSPSPAPTSGPPSGPSSPPASSPGSAPQNWEGRPREFLEQIIRPTLQELGVHSTAAERLLLGTAVAESLLKYRRQIQGPALGLFQMEPDSHDDIYENFLNYPGRAVLKQKIVGMLSSPNADKHEELVNNDRYACAMARMQYYRFPASLPSADDLDGLARYWKRYYNTAKGAGTVAGFKEKWQAIVGPWPPNF
ncbi:MAG: hypothetical protein Tsb0010_00360 [Parvularculaceae bacterium]